MRNTSVVPLSQLTCHRDGADWFVVAFLSVVQPQAFHPLRPLRTRDSAIRNPRDSRVGRHWKGTSWWHGEGSLPSLRDCRCYHPTWDRCDSFGTVCSGGSTCVYRNPNIPNTQHEQYVRCREHPTYAHLKGGPLRGTITNSSWASNTAKYRSSGL